MKTTLQHSPGLERVRKILDEAEGPARRARSSPWRMSVQTPGTTTHRAPSGNKEIHVAGRCYHLGWRQSMPPAPERRRESPKCRCRKSPSEMEASAPAITLIRDTPHRRLARLRDPILFRTTGVAGYQNTRYKPGENSMNAPAVVTRNTVPASP